MKRALSCHFGEHGKRKVYKGENIYENKETEKA
jgi:hypothetical protein